MATKSVGTIRALMEMASRKYVSDTAKGEKANKKFNKGAQRGFRNSNKSAGLFTGGMKRMLGVTVALAGPAALGALIKSTLKTADTIAKTADKVGFATDALQEIRFAAKQSGVEFTATDIALQRFSRRIGEAANGQGVLFKTLTDNNIALRDQNGSMRSSSDILDDYADLIGRADDQQTKLLLTFQAFDTEGAALVNLLGEGSGEMKKLRQEARDLGLVLDEDLLRGAEDANDALDKMSSTMKTQLSKQVLEMAPAIETLATKFIDGLPGMLDFAKAFAEFIGLIDKSEADKLGEQIDENNNKIRQSKELLKDLKEQVLPGIEYVTPKQAEDIKNLESNIFVLEERNRQLTIALIRLNAEQERVSESEEDLSEDVDDNTKSVVLNTRVWIRQQEMLAIMASTAYPDISDAMRETERRIKNLNEGLDEGDDLTVQLTRSMDSFENSMARGIVSGGDMEDILQDLIREMGAAILKAKILGPLMDQIASGGKGGRKGNVVDLVRKIPVVGEFIGGVVDFLGFQKGGSFMVPGDGGTDSQFVGIKGTRREKITIQTPSQQAAGIFPGSGMAAAGGGINFTIQQTVIFEGITPEEDLQNRIIPGIESAARAAATDILTLKNLKDGSTLGGDLMRTGKA